MERRLPCPARRRVDVLVAHPPADRRGAALGRRDPPRSRARPEAAPRKLPLAHPEVATDPAANVYLEIDLVGKQLKVGDTVLEEADWVSLDGTRGVVYAGKMINTGKRLLVKSQTNCACTRSTW